MSAPEKVEITLPELYDDWPELIRDLRRFTTHTLADQIEAQLPTPEPTALGTLIRDAEGAIWVLSYRSTRGEHSVWTRDDGRRRCWGDIPQPVTVLHEGWKPEDES